METGMSFALETTVSPMPFYYQRSFLVAARLWPGIHDVCENSMEASEPGFPPSGEERAWVSIHCADQEACLCALGTSAPSLLPWGLDLSPGAWLSASCQLILAKVLGGKGSRVINPRRSFPH